MLKAMLRMARVEKEQCSKQCCVWQGWKKTNVQSNVAYDKGGKRAMFKAMLRMAWVEKDQCSKQCFATQLTVKTNIQQQTVTHM